MTRLGLVVARFNQPITEEMADRARTTAAERDVTIERVNVPGAYDAPLAADRLARRKEVRAVAVIGAIISGETDHDQVIGHALADHLTTISLDRDTPVTLGVTGPGMTAEQARDRVAAGSKAVESALDLLDELPEAGP